MMAELSSRADETASRSARSGGWRDAFLSRRGRRGERGAATDDNFVGASRRSDSAGLLDRENLGASRARSLSRPRASRGEGGAEAAFDQQAVLEQDRALIEQLTQRLPRQGQQTRAPVKKPPPPPKVTPYRPRSDSLTPQSADGATVPPSPSSSSKAPSPEKEPFVQGADAGTLAVGTISCEAQVSPPQASLKDDDGEARETFETPGLQPEHPFPVATPDAPKVPAAATQVPPTSASQCAVPPAELSPRAVPSVPAPAAMLEPIVPRSGQLFTANDIDSIMDRLDVSGPSNTISQSATDGLGEKQRVKCTQNAGDISQDFFRSHGLEAIPSQFETSAGEMRTPSTAKVRDEFEVPQRRALKEQIQAMDSWLEDDFAAREQLNKIPGFGGLATATMRSSATDPAATLKELTAAATAADGGGTEVADIIQKLEAVKARKAQGDRCHPVALKNVAAQIKPLLPGLPLEKLVHILRLFTSARFEDNDLYLRMLGEIPVQIRGISAELLTTCVRVLWRLRLHEATYLELFSMEAMNMIRAKRRGPSRAPPRRPPALRTQNVDVAATAAVSSGAMPTPTAPPPKEAPAPFSATQLVHIGNSLSQLGAKPPSRFMEVYQEQLVLAIPRLTQEECELICPTLAMSQLLPDALRRSFLERCAQVDAGSFPGPPGHRSDGGAAPDIAKYQSEAERRRKREKNFRNLYIIETSIRKETFSFFSSLPAEIRTYLDRLHGESARLPHEGTNGLAAQVAAVLDQLGVTCDMSRMAGPLGLHIVAKACGPSRQIEEIVYECNDAVSYYAVRQEDNAPELTAYAKLRHRLLQRLGVKLTHIGIWEWQSLSEAQRVNYMVKLQSLQ